MNNQEKTYKNLTNSGILNIATGVVIIAVGIAAGVLVIVNGAKLLFRRRDILI